MFLLVCSAFGERLYNYKDSLRFEKFAGINDYLTAPGPDRTHADRIRTMVVEQGKDVSPAFSFTSSIADDVWTPDKGSKGYEWWYFDALSDTERDAVVIIFLDNFIFSPRYNSLNRTISSDPSALVKDETFPAVAFCYYRDGKPLIRSIIEYPEDLFSADPSWPYCRIGDSSFRFDRAPYGEGYSVEVSAPLRGGKRLVASFEWLSIESDLVDNGSGTVPGIHCWNLVAPRSDVTGKIQVLNDKGKEVEEYSFRGTGYHDHNADTRWLPDAVEEWTWGRVHFADATAVFYDYRGLGGRGDVSNLYLVTGNDLKASPADFESVTEKRDIFGLKYPSRLIVNSLDGARLDLESECVIDSSFFYDRILYKATLSMHGSSEKTSRGIGEFLVPGKLRRGIFDKLIDMRIGKGGSPSFLP